MNTDIGPLVAAKTWRIWAEEVPWFLRHARTIPALRAWANAATPALRKTARRMRWVEWGCVNNAALEAALDQAVNDLEQARVEVGGRRILPKWADGSYRPRPQS